MRHPEVDVERRMWFMSCSLSLEVYEFVEYHGTCP